MRNNINTNTIYIGKRSKLLNIILSDLPKGNRISFKKAQEYSEKEELKDKIIILFALPERNKEEEYFQFIKNVKCKFFINISSTSIFAMSIYKMSLNIIPRYLSIKYYAHKLTNEKINSLNLVIGIFDEKAPFPLFPLTTYTLLISELSSLIEKISNKNNIPIKREFYCFKLKESNFNKITYLPFILRLIANRLPFGLVIVIDIIYKIFGLGGRGYTAISVSLFSKMIRIGDGSFGTASSSKEDTILYSAEKNKSLPGKLINTSIGYNKIGLDALRHGVITFNDNGNIKKIWKPSFRLRSILRNSYPYHVESINWINESNYFILNCNYKGLNIILFSKKIKFAAGSFENSRLLISLSDQDELSNIKFSDHFIKRIGLISFEEATSNDIIKTLVPNIIFKRNNLIPIKLNKKLKGFAEPRINKRKNTFIEKITSNLNSYIFNRFGILFFSKNKLELWVQLVTENSIGIDYMNAGYLNLIPTQSLIEQRKILSEKSISTIRKLFSTFEKNPSKDFPAHHLWGGGALLKNKLIKELIDEKKIFICGSPSEEELGPFHHTLRICKDLRLKSYK